MEKVNQFKSVQKCKQPFMWVIIVGIALFIWYSIFQQIVLGNPIGNNPASDLVLIIIWMVIGIGFPLALFAMKLIIKIDSENFSYRLFPLHFRMHSYRLDDIESMEVVTYRPILDFGGWGIRWGHKGKGYIISGKKGVKVQFRAGRPVYFSSDEPEEVVRAYRNLSPAS
ncbi:MAG: DUF6141 family protein [Balneolaceae bacterium]|nr:DUF6141 family protein [Balneolaceae bacterium]MDR9408993.1 DUF6141 family protein [Balneolaceae bacterium]